MKEKRKLTPEEILASLEDHAEEAPLDEEDEKDIARVLAMSPEELDRALEAEGFDPAAIEAKAEALLGGKAPAAPSLPTVVHTYDERALDARANAKARTPVAVPPMRRARARLQSFVAATAMAASAGGMWLATASTGALPVGAALDAGASPADLRRDALEALRHGEPARAIELLDEAKAKDPAGDMNEPARTLRNDALSALGR